MFSLVSHLRRGKLLFVLFYQYFAPNGNNFLKILDLT